MAARKPAKEKAVESQPAVPENFKVIDYEGLDLLKCQYPKCGFDTFDVGSARAHAATHPKEDADGAS